MMASSEVPLSATLSVKVLNLVVVSSNVVVVVVTSYVVAVVSVVSINWLPTAPIPLISWLLLDVVESPLLRHLRLLDVVVVPVLDHLVLLGHHLAASWIVEVARVELTGGVVF